MTRRAWLRLIAVSGRCCSSFGCPPLRVRVRVVCVVVRSFCSAVWQPLGVSWQPRWRPASAVISERHPDLFIIQRTVPTVVVVILAFLVNQLRRFRWLVARELVTVAVTRSVSRRDTKRECSAAGLSKLTWAFASNFCGWLKSSAGGSRP